MTARISACCPVWPMPAKRPLRVPVTNTPPRIRAPAPTTRAQEPLRTFCIKGEPMTEQPRSHSDGPHAPETKPPAAPCFAKRRTGDRPAPVTDATPVQPVLEKKGNETNPKIRPHRTANAVRSEKRTQVKPIISPNEPTQPAGERHGMTIVLPGSVQTNWRSEAKFGGDRPARARRSLSGIARVCIGQEPVPHARILPAWRNAVRRGWRVSGSADLQA